MLTAQKCLKVFGNPSLLATQQKHMVMRNVPPECHIPTVPSRIYCNKQMVVPLEAVFLDIKAQGLEALILTWDGCFNDRKKRGASTASLHSWGVAVDINAAHNQFGKPPTMDPRIVAIFKKHGFDWGGDWTTKKDGMHFQLRDIAG
jgi:hypothetical protein